MDKDGQPLPDLKKSAKVSKGQAGDPRFLERVCWCVEQRCKILGLYAKDGAGASTAAFAVITQGQDGDNPTLAALIQRMLGNSDARLAACEYVEAKMLEAKGERGE